MVRVFVFVYLNLFGYVSFDSIAERCFLVKSDCGFFVESFMKKIGVLFVVMSLLIFDCCFGGQERHFQKNKVNRISNKIYFEAINELACSVGTQLILSSMFIFFKGICSEQFFFNLFNNLHIINFILSDDEYKERCKGNVYKLLASILYEVLETLTYGFGKTNEFKSILKEIKETSDFENISIGYEVYNSKKRDCMSMNDDFLPEVSLDYSDIDDMTLVIKKLLICVFDSVDNNFFCGKETVCKCPLNMFCISRFFILFLEQAVTFKTFAEKKGADKLYIDYEWASMLIECSDFRPQKLDDLYEPLFVFFNVSKNI
jgi:hypothetical protein